MTKKDIIDLIIKKIGAVLRKYPLIMPRSCIHDIVKCELYKLSWETNYIPLPEVRLGTNKKGIVGRSKIIDMIWVNSVDLKDLIIFEINGIHTMGTLLRHIREFSNVTVFNIITYCNTNLPSTGESLKTKISLRGDEELKFMIGVKEIKIDSTTYDIISHGGPSENYETDLTTSEVVPNTFETQADSTIVQVELSTLKELVKLKSTKTEGYSKVLNKLIEAYKKSINTEKVEPENSNQI